MEDVERLLKGTVEELDKLINAKNVLAEPIEKDGAVVYPMVSYGWRRRGWRHQAARRDHHRRRGGPPGSWAGSARPRRPCCSPRTTG